MTDRFAGIGGVLHAVGVVAGLFISLWIVNELNGLGSLLLLSSALLSFSVSVLAGRKNLLVAAGGIWVGAGLLWVAGNIQVDSYIRWNTNSDLITKQLSAALATQKEARADSTAWDDGMRLDRMVGEGSAKDGMSWLLTNGTSPVTKLSDPGRHNQEWWKRRFPLLMFPLHIARPDHMLMVGPSPGPGAHMAHLQGVSEIRSMEYAIDPNAWQDLMSKGLSGPAGPFDLVTLSISHPVQGAWVGANSQDESLLTMEMFQWYWQQLGASGILSITIRDEALFAKALISVWVMMGVTGEQSVSGLGDRLRVFRLNSYAPFKGSYSYLIMASRGVFDKAQLAQLRQLESIAPVEPLIYDSGIRSGLYRIFKPFVSVTFDDATSFFEHYFS